VSALFNHESGDFNAQVLNSFGRRLARLMMKRAAEQPWTEMRGFRELVDSQRRVKIAPSIIKSILDAIRLWLEFSVLSYQRRSSTSF
jgi:hypothetical protein